MFLVAVDLHHRKSFTCGFIRKSDPLHSSTDAEMKRKLHIVAVKVFRAPSPVTKTLAIIYKCLSIL